MELFDKKETRNREMRERENSTRQRKTKNSFINMLVNIHHARGNEGYFKNNYFSAPSEVICIANV